MNKPTKKHFLNYHLLI